MSIVNDAGRNANVSGVVDERAAVKFLQNRNHKASNEPRHASSELKKLDLVTLMKLDKSVIQKYWTDVLDCVDYIYRQASDRRRQAANGDSTALFAEAAAEGKPKMDANGQLSMTEGRAWNRAASTIRTIANEYVTKHPIVASRVNINIFYDLCVNEILGLGIIQPIWEDPRVEEVWIDGPYQVNISIKGQKRMVKGASFKDANHVLRFCENILKQADRSDLHLDTKNPYVDARLRDYSRVAIESTAVNPLGPIVSIRRHPSDYFTISQLTEWGTCTQEMWRDLGQWVNGKMSILVIGETGSGKTSFLDALSGLFPNEARIMSIEDVLELELNPNKPFKVPGCEKREPNKEGEGGFSIRDHVKASLRMAPDIVVIGEVRDKAAYDLVDAANTGHQVFSTLHANSAEDAVTRLVNLISTSGEITGEAALPMIASAFDLIVCLDRLQDGSRKVMSISEVGSRVEFDTTTQTNVVRTPLIWEFVQTGETENGEILGEHRKTGELSPLCTRRHRLNFVKRPTWEQCLQLEGFIGKSTKIER